MKFIFLFIYLLSFNLFSQNNLKVDTGFYEYFGKKNERIQYFIHSKKDSIKILTSYKSNLGISFSEILKKFDKVKFMMNGGMYNSNYQPVGLYINNYELINPIDTSGYKNNGNFYLQPNGVFFIDLNNNGGILTSSKFKEYNLKYVKYATQSGPMLLIDGKINDILNPKSESFKYRNGVGILPNGNIVFAISKTRIRFYDFACFFLNELHCKNALYLDGEISGIYEKNNVTDENLNKKYGPMIIIY